METPGTEDLMPAYRRVIEVAASFDGLRRGLHECVKSLDKQVAHICFMTEDGDYDDESRSVEAKRDKPSPNKQKLLALCRQANIPIVMVASRETLGEWVGLAKMGPGGAVRKAVKCSIAVITNFGMETPELANVRGALSI